MTVAIVEAPLDAASRDLRRMKIVATTMLAVTALAYLALSLVPDAGLGLAALRATMEAATVGGFADWFAVVALFRRPLGLPIPHTALIASNRDKLAVTISDFVVDKFVTKDEIVALARDTDIPAKLGDWLASNQAEVLKALDVPKMFSGMAGSAFGWVADAFRTSNGLRDMIDQLAETKAPAIQAQIRNRIHDRIRTWDADEMVRELEKSVGRDLQFIRLNGTVMGGLAGLALFLLHRGIERLG